MFLLSADISFIYHFIKFLLFKCTLFLCSYHPHLRTWCKKSRNVSGRTKRNPFFKISLKLLRRGFVRISREVDGIPFQMDTDQIINHPKLQRFDTLDKSLNRKLNQPIDRTGIYYFSNNFRILQNQ